MFLEWENNNRKLKIISGKFQNNAINDIKQISLSHVIMYSTCCVNKICKMKHPWKEVESSQNALCCIQNSILLWYFREWILNG